MNREFTKDEYTISTDHSKLQFDVIHNFLKTTYWSKDIEFETVKKASENSFCFGMYINNKQIGFARLITDRTSFAYIADVFILEEHRGKGLSKWLMEVMLNLPELNEIRKWALRTADAHSLYSRFGFKSPTQPESYMEYVCKK
ncbi:MAG: GNAT family N-acetyltransferase [Melioribacteraceae bacterium]